MEKNMNENNIQVNLPVEMILKIFGYLSYDEVSKTRLICKQMNEVASDYLNAGFKTAQDQLTKTFREIKDGLPRRESERRKHPLYPKHDALVGLDTRISLLRMTYNKYIAAGLCCFIPGKVLDEIFFLLKKVKILPKLPSTSLLLQEVRDISSMAMEHFDEAIVPSFQPDLVTVIERSIPVSDFEPQITVQQFEPQSTITMKQMQRDLRNLKQTVQRKNNQVRKLSLIVKRHKKLLQDVHSQVAELNTQTQALRSVLTSTDSDSISSHLCTKCVAVIRSLGGAEPTASEISENAKINLKSELPHCSHNVAKRKLENAETANVPLSKCAKF
nr:F-box only protein 28 [Ciona intestinalis]|eukprot:XP_002124169.3 F-box only protein 28 [Ciona intestinalis]